MREESQNIVMQSNGTISISQEFQKRERKGLKVYLNKS